MASDSIQDKITLRALHVLAESDSTTVFAVMARTWVNFPKDHKEARATARVALLEYIQTVPFLDEEFEEFETIRNKIIKEEYASEIAAWHASEEGKAYAAQSK